MSTNHHEEFMKLVQEGRLAHERKEAEKRAEKEALRKSIGVDAQSYFKKFVEHVRQEILENPTKSDFGWSTEYKSYYPLPDGEGLLLEEARAILREEFPEANVFFDRGDGYKSFLAFHWKPNPT